MGYRIASFQLQPFRERVYLARGNVCGSRIGRWLLALAAMQGISLGKNVDANELTLATNLAADMVERIQFNRRNAIVYQNIDTLDASTNPVSNIMASGDYDQWQARLQASRLPSVRGRVAVTSYRTNESPLNQNQVIVASIGKALKQAARL